MRTKKSTYITWIVVVVILIGGIGLIVQGQKNKEERLAAKFQDVKEDEQPAESGSSPTPASAEGPYKTEGGNDQENDNFFIKGRVESLPSLVDKEKTATVVWVGASWCEICHAMRPFVWKSANKFADKIALKEIDFDDNPHIARAHQILGTPGWFVMDRNGTIVDRFSGATQSQFEAKLKQASQLQ